MVWKQLIFTMGLVGFSTPIQADTTDDMSSVQELTNGWLEIRPGGRTSCAFGDPYAFFVRPGDSDRLLVHYQGGGACWDGKSCMEGKPTFRSDINDLLGAGPDSAGIFNFDREDNPYNSWTHVYVPYCTGDVHWGDNDQTYTRNGVESFTIRHRGAVNAKSALQWMQEYIQEPDQVVVTGCSAGSYGSIYWTPYVRELFADADFSQLGDAGAGVLTENFKVNYFPNWNPDAHAADWIEGIDPAANDWAAMPFTNLYESIGRHYPGIRLAQYNADKDLVQRLFYKIMGGSIFSWKQKMLTSMQVLSAALPQFRYYISGKRKHCITDDASFYRISRRGFSFRDWMESYIHGDPVTDVD